MWQKIAGIILRNRVAILVVIGLITLVQGFMATQVKIRYDFAALLPSTDSTLINYKDFKQRFGEDGDVLVIGIEQEDFFKKDVYNAWYELGKEVSELEGIEEVVSAARCYNLVRNDSLKKFDFSLIHDGPVETQAQLDSIKAQIVNLKFYDNVMWDEESHISVMAITMNATVLDSKKRVALTDQIVAVGDKYEDRLGVNLRYSGMPYIRSLLAKVVKAEMFLFILYALLVTAVIMFIFFRSFKVVMVAMLVVAIGSLWSIGFVAVMGFQLSILTGLVPPLIIVIGVANCIFLLNKYHTEYRSHGNKIKGLQRVVRKVGKATLLTNATTAAGFATFTVVESSVMREFGVVAAISIMCIFVLSLLLVPIIFSFLKEPKARHVKHLDRKQSQVFISKIVEIVLSYRSRVYWFFGTCVVVGIYGITLITSDGKIVDDFPENHHVLKDLAFFEEQFNGVVPFEIQIDALKPGKALSPATLKRIDKLQDAISAYPEFSRAVSMTEIVKSLKQAYYNGMPSKYGLPSGAERGFILSYADNDKGNKDASSLLKSFIDSSQQITRVSFQMKDVGTDEAERLIGEIRPVLDSIFNPDKYQTLITGTSVVYLRGTEYLVKNLFISLGIAVVLIALLMAYMFRSWRMVAVSLIPNIIPLILTGALMGFLGITIKPSTILVFSIAFGISVDDTIHFLAKYRQELEVNNWRIKRSVILALHEVGLSMAYTSIVLFFGFSIFHLSTFGGTKALGMLVSITLLVAMFSNLILLPSLLLTLERSLTTKYFKDAGLDTVYPEEETETELSVQNQTT
ncbi:MAG: MMPL family transporter [Flavobacteriales bacterium]|nr:MMPL family transporter [Flavobacteriales bacterium]MCB9204499.1 MMPL family transporter [Flavobacteriales bacterium]